MLLVKVVMQICVLNLFRVPTDKPWKLLYLSAATPKPHKGQPQK